MAVAYIKERTNECIVSFVRIDLTKPTTFDFFITNLNKLIQWIKFYDDVLYSKFKFKEETIKSYIIGLNFIQIPTIVTKIIDEYKKIDRILTEADVEGFSDIIYPSNNIISERELIEGYNKYLDAFNSIYSHLYICIRDLTDLEYEKSFEFGNAEDRYKSVLHWNNSGANPTRDFSGYKVQLIDKNDTVLEQVTTPISGVCSLNEPSDWEGIKIRVLKGDFDCTYNTLNLDENNKIASIYINFESDYTY